MYFEEMKWKTNTGKQNMLIRGEIWVNIKFNINNITFRIQKIFQNPDGNVGNALIPSYFHISCHNVDGTERTESFFLSNVSHWTFRIQPSHPQDSALHDMQKRKNKKNKIISKRIIWILNKFHSFEGMFWLLC